MDILIEFAKKHGIEKSEVKEFIKKYSKKVKTVEQLLCVPNHLRKHYSNVDSFPETLTDFLQEYIVHSRDEVILLESIVEFSERTLKEYHEMIRAYKNDEESRVHYEKRKQKLEKEYDEIKELLVKLKFGSAVWDW